ncbi:MAG: hypothetical protein CMI63_17355 [Parvularcula sp.]|nr:hypothetical protein [Parvularcula sp.]
MQYFVMRERKKRYSPEFRLILGVLSSSQPGISDNPDIDWPEVDWNEFFQLLRRHRITGLVANLLLSPAGEHKRSPLPKEIIPALAEAQRQSLAQEMAALVEARALIDLFEDNGLAPILLKGLTLSHDAFGRIGWRNNYDTDILLRPDEILLADRLLRERNYSRFEPAEDANDQKWALWRRRRKDAAYRNQKSGSIVELHWRLFDNPAILPAPLRTRKADLLGNLCCTMLEPDVNFAYICCHGSQHAFSRLKWLADVYFLARKKSEAELAALLETTPDPYARAAIAQALLLCSKLFGLSLPSDTLMFEKTNIRLAAWMADKTLTRGGSREIETLPFGATLKTLSHYLMSAAPDYLAREALFDAREKLHGRTTI